MATYVSGHHSSVLRSHTWRTAENSAAYLIPHLQANYKLLDVGCGPATITLDFAQLLTDGEAVGIDTSSAVIDQAITSAAERGVHNASFHVGDILDSPSAFPDGSFDVTHAHQVLQHVQDPVKAMSELRRISRNIVAVRETDFSSAAWYPLLPGLEEWRQLWIKVNRAGGLDPDMGRRLLSVAMQSGFERQQITSTASTWCYTTAEEREWWSSLWAERLMQSDFARSALKSELASKADLERMADAWKAWGAAEDAWFVFLHGEVICRKKA